MIGSSVAAVLSEPIPCIPKLALLMCQPFQIPIAHVLADGHDHSGNDELHDHKDNMIFSYLLCVDKQRFINLHNNAWSS